MGKETKDEDDPTGLRRYAKIIGEMNGDCSTDEQPAQPAMKEPEATCGDGSAPDFVETEYGDSNG